MAMARGHEDERDALNNQLGELGALHDGVHDRMNRAEALNKKWRQVFGVIADQIQKAKNDFADDRKGIDKDMRGEIESAL
jgi:hypothetical protein